MRTYKGSAGKKAHGTVIAMLVGLSFLKNEKAGIL
jgi:hypothetical protein